jgi:hypothetical protein
LTRLQGAVLTAMLLTKDMQDFFKNNATGVYR